MPHRLFNLPLLQYVQKGSNVTQGSLSQNVNTLKHPRGLFSSKLCTKKKRKIIKPSQNHLQTKLSHADGQAVHSPPFFHILFSNLIRGSDLD